jgi:4-hydroxythreonine-4-phosphate dehydrogenase
MTRNVMKKPLIITMGDPTGVGPEIILQAVSAGAFTGLSRPLVVAGDLAVLLRAAEVCGCDVLARADSQLALASSEILINDFVLPVHELSLLDLEQQSYGQPGISAGRAMADYISWACDACVSGEAAGMVTAPINKQALQAAGTEFPGHTELLADRCQVDQVVMMLAGERLKVCLVTTHCALREVPEQLTRERILSTMRIVSASLQKQFGLERPRLAVLALNPHAGEGGLFGDEEQRHIVLCLTGAI